MKNEDLMEFLLEKPESNRLTISARKREAENEDDSEYMRIEELMGSIDEKNRNMNDLLKEKTKITNKIKTLMDFHAYTRTPLSEKQMDSFSHFTGFYAEEAGALKEALKKIEDQKNLQTTKKELLHNHADYSMIVEELTNLSETQSDAICYLRNIIDFGNKTLHTLWYAIGA
ncbi:MAG: hypothetical protein LBU32_25025 [Clostridiales bacterium]|nr:hypothetical protein [Clostridiales bacterium]